MERCFKCMKEYDGEQGKCPHCGYDNNQKPSELYHIVPGSILEGRYMIGCCVGQGGFGITYIGWDLQLERKVAVKEYFPSDFATRAYGDQNLTIYKGEAGEQFSSGLKSFIDEAQRLAKFNGIKGIVDIYDTFITNNTGYIVMEFLSGISLKDMLKANKFLDYPTAKEIIVEMLYILKEVHKDGIIHRDIAPDNIFITDSGEFKLLDFGAARYATTTHSKSLSVILKPGYAPEEQYRSHGNQGPWTDIYALAATFYKLITGITPPEAMERRTGDNLVPPSKLGVQMPKNDEIALLNALNILPENRTANAQEFLDALGGKKVTRKKERNLYTDTGKMYKFVAPLVSVSVLIVVVFLALIKLKVIDLNYWGEVIKQQAKLPDGYAIVRNVVGQKDVYAIELLDKDGFEVTMGESYYSDTVDADYVVAQTPVNTAEKAGEKDIMLVVSKGAKTASLGLFKGRSLTEVAAELDVLGFYNVNSVEGTENKLIKGSIEKIEIDGKEVGENEEFKLSSNVIVYVSTGENYVIDKTNKVKVPSWVGKKYSSVTGSITKSKLAVGYVKEEYSDKYDKGVIISQNPINTEVNEGTRINFVVSKGKKSTKATVPNVKYSSESAAKSEILAAGLSVGGISYEYSDSVKQGLVISQSPAAGKTVSVNSGVSIVISNGRKPEQPKPTPTPAPTPTPSEHDYILPPKKEAEPQPPIGITQPKEEEERKVIEPERITLSKSRIDVEPGDKVTIAADVYPEFADNTRVSWSVNGSIGKSISSDTRTITLDCYREGRFVVTASTINGLIDECIIEVESLDVPVMPDDPDVEIEVGREEPEIRHPVSVSSDRSSLSGGESTVVRASCDANVSWETDGPLVSISVNGNEAYITANYDYEGTAVITATSPTGESDSCRISIIYAPSHIEEPEPPPEEPPQEDVEEVEVPADGGDAVSGEVDSSNNGDYGAEVYAE